MAKQDNFQSSPQLRVWWRHWSVVFILAVLAGLVIWAMLNLGPWLRSWQEQRAATAARKQLEKTYLEDKYGGKTPEETFDMFIAALEKGDVELASKYFVFNKQDEWKKTLEEYKNKSLLNNLTNELKNNKNNWQFFKDEERIRSYRYNYVVETPFIEELPLGNGKTQKLTHPAGEFNAEIIFEKNTLADIWKISVL